MNLNSFFEIKDTINCLTVIADMFNKKSVNFATSLQVQREELKECSKAFDKNGKNLFALSIKINEVFITQGDLKKKPLELMVSQLESSKFRFRWFFLKWSS